MRGVRNSRNACSVSGCGKPAHGFGLCASHYHVYRRDQIKRKLWHPTINNTPVEVHAPVVPPYTPPEPVTPVLSEEIFRFLQGNKDQSMTLELLSDKFDVGIGKIRAALEALADAGKNVHIDQSLGTAAVTTDIASSEDSRIDVGKFDGDAYLFGFTADNHLCSKYARMDVLNALFDIWKSQGVKTVLQAGNMIDGEARFNKFDLLVAPGLEAQADYLMNEWPYREGMTTEFVCGDDHEGWYVQREGINIVNYLTSIAKQVGRTDMVFKAYMEHTYNFVGDGCATSMTMQHAGGGSAYATSYTVQKIVESYQPNEKPSILLVGHYHKAEFGYPRAVLTVQAGCTQDQSPFLRKRRIEAMVGGWTLGFKVDQTGVVHGFTPQWHPFYDRDFYKRWSYHWQPKGKPS